MKRLLLVLLPNIASAHPCPPGTTHHEGMENSESSRTAHWCWNAGTHGYKAGQLDGAFTQQYASGNKLRTGSYRAGKKHGTWKVWYEKGQRQAEYEYADDKLVKSREWTRRGEELGGFKPL